MDIPAGILTEDDDGYHFTYYKSYLERDKSKGISLTLPLQKETFYGSALFPFFDGLIPEGWLLKIAEANWKLDQRDRMGLLLQCCRDCIGAVSIHGETGNE
ncbi:HipA N-terminal domain-containing protein [Oceanispirochaeta sp. M1]|uniref:HipA N-terminal domain-containing protein n=2 Tax=Oceanispirochaeta TaxID=2035349 RepID=UPI0020A6BBC4|nr:HipA N-terminal domain-containing protein [Oceanispirochaeta sp. M1]